MVSKFDIYTFVLLALCSVAAIVNIYYGENPDSDVINVRSITDKSIISIVDKYTLVYKLSIGILTLCLVAVVLLTLKYGGITHKIISLLILLSIAGVVFLSFITLIFGVYPSPTYFTL